jgi:xanthine dehydrogenase accessory factor
MWVAGPWYRYITSHGRFELPQIVCDHLGGRRLHRPKSAYDLLAEGRHLGTLVGFAAGTGRHDRLRECLVEAVHQHPGAAIRHFHGAAGGGNRAELGNQLEQLHLAGAEPDRVAEIQPQRDVRCLSDHSHRLTSSDRAARDGCCARAICGSMPMSVAPLVLVRGIGDVGSAVAHILFRQGYAVVIHDGPAPPTAHRRGMAFTDAVFDGSAQLDGIYACRVEALDCLPEQASGRLFLPVITGPFATALTAAPWFILIDARMRKREIPEPQQGLAPLTIGLGPGFVAGTTVDVAIETAWGDHLGRVIANGPTRALAGEPKPINGVGRERVVYSPGDGIWHTRRNIGDAVESGKLVGWLSETPVVAPLTGLLRGVTRDGVPCRQGTKIVEVDPRPPSEAVIRGLGERPRRIAEGVITAIECVVAAPRPRRVRG